MNKFEELGKAIDQEFDIQREMIYHLYDELNKQKTRIQIWQQLFEVLLTFLNQIIDLLHPRQTAYVLTEQSAVD